MGGRTSTASKNKHLANAYDRPHSFVMPKGSRAAIEACAAADGISISKWMNGAIQEKIERYNMAHPEEPIYIVDNSRDKDE